MGILELWREAELANAPGRRSITGWLPAPNNNDFRGAHNCRSEQMWVKTERAYTNSQTALEVESPAANQNFSGDVIGKRRAEEQHCARSLLWSTHPAECASVLHRFQHRILRPELNMMPVHFARSALPPPLGLRGCTRRVSMSRSRPH